MIALPAAAAALLAALAARPAAGQDSTAAAPPATAPTGAALNAAGRPLRTAQAARVQGQAPAIDGRLDDGAWLLAPAITGFTQRQPVPGAPCSQRTEVRVLYDEDAVYVGMRLHDTAPDSIARQLGRRDLTGVFSDWVHVIIDSYHDRRTAFRFSLNPFGVQKDVLHFDDSNEDLGWDAVWQSAARVDSAGWAAEYRIPLSQLRFSSRNKKGQLDEHGQDLVWGINFGRDIARNNERTEWSPIYPDVSGYISQSGDLLGIREVRPPRQLEVAPYSLGRLTRAPGLAADPFYDRNDVDPKIGLDFKYGLTSNIMATGTVNPDFGEVEADPSVFTLTAFETRFPEKRPFFLEGSSFFVFDYSYDDGAGEQLFYSRRVGRRPQGRPGNGAVYSDIPDNTTILGAAKLSGKTAGGWTVGLLDAVTSREEAKVQDSFGARREDALEPLTNYAVARAIHDFRRGESALGAIVTATHRKLDDASLDFLRTSAYTGGIDLRHRWAKGNYQVSALVAGSAIQGSKAALRNVQLSPVHYFQRPDADHIEFDPDRTSLQGGLGHLWFSKPGGHWRGGIGGHYRSPGFETNDVGYVRQADQTLAFSNIRYEQFKPGKSFRRWSLGINPSAIWTSNLEPLGGGINLNYNFDLNNQWGGYAGGRRDMRGLSVATLQGGPALAYNASNSYWAGYYSNARARVRVDLDTDGWTEDGTDGWGMGIRPIVYVRPSGRVDLTLFPSLSFNNTSWQFFDTAPVGGVPHYLFGRLDQTTAALTTRLSYSFTRALTLQLYGQPFMTAGDYSEFMEVADPRAHDIQKRFRRYSASELAYDGASQTYSVDLDGDAAPDLGFSNPDFNFKQFRSTMVLRWEYRPGSALFVVWGDDRTAYEAVGDFRLGRDMRKLFDADGTDIFLVKLSYWMDI